MPFPLDEKYIIETEDILNLRFPRAFREKMMKENGGEVEIGDNIWNLFPFFDKTDIKRISRTNNHILKETENSKEWSNYPVNAISIGENSCGDKLILYPEENNPQELSESIHVWWHETGNVEKLADSFEKLQYFQ